MKDDKDDQRRVSRWALPGSLAAHVLVALLVIFGLPVSLFEPEEEQAVNVDLVPPPKPPEKPKAETPPPPPEKSEEKKAEKPPPQNDEAARAAATQPVLRPVFQFGEKDAGPRQSPDGNSPQEGSASPEAKRKPDKRDVAEPPALAADKQNGQAAPPPGAPETAPPKPTQAARKQEAEKPKEAKRLFSQNATGGLNATIAMGNVPRGVRAGRLCVTELREQLRNSLPPYYPDLLPSYRLDEGTTVIDAPRAAFRVAGEWYDLSYRCEVDANATKVVAFAYRVGAPLPPSEWERRKLPAR
jgi:hypothetical protein